MNQSTQEPRMNFVLCALTIILRHAFFRQNIINRSASACSWSMRLWEPRQLICKGQCYIFKFYSRMLILSNTSMQEEHKKHESWNYTVQVQYPRILWSRMNTEKWISSFHPTREEDTHLKHHEYTISYCLVTYWNLGKKFKEEIQGKNT